MSLEKLRQLRDYAAAVLAVIENRKLEGAEHITPKSQLAHQCRDELENAGHYLTHLLHELPRVQGQEGLVLVLPFESLRIEQHSIAQAADGLLSDADMGLFGGESWEHREHYGTTTVSPIVCKQLREGIALLNGLFEPETMPETIETQSEGNVDVAGIIENLSVLFGGGDAGKKMLAVVNDPSLSTEQKLRAMERLDKPLMARLKSTQLGELLDVTGQAIRKTDWWLERRQDD